jgi:hypothetical protein
MVKKRSDVILAAVVLNRSVHALDGLVCPMNDVVDLLMR